MIFATKIRQILATLGFIGMCGPFHAWAHDGELYDLQPCPAVLANDEAPQPNKQWDLTLSPHTHHWSHNPDHKPVFLVALDRHLNGSRFCGMALFSNSFGQESAYFYVGQQWDGLFDHPKLFTKLSGGLIYGYRHAYKEKVPFNKYGVSPVIIPSLGYAITPQDAAQVYVLGTAGLLFAYSRSF